MEVGETMKIELGGLTDFQARAVMIIAGVHGKKDADELADKYRADNDEKDRNAVEYTLEELVAIPAYCPRCKRSFLGRDAIRAPSLDNCGCFYCGSVKHVRLVLHPEHKGFIDAKTRREMKEAPLFHQGCVTP